MVVAIYTLNKHYFYRVGELFDVISTRLPLFVLTFPVEIIKTSFSCYQICVGIYIDLTRYLNDFSEYSLNTNALLVLANSCFFAGTLVARAGSIPS